MPPGAATVRRPLPVLVGLGLLAAGVALYAVWTVTGWPPGPETLYLHWLADGVIGLSVLVTGWRARTVSRDRRAWTAITCALAIYFVGDLYWNRFLAAQESPPYPSVADGLWLLFYVPAYVGIALLLRGNAARTSSSELLDALIAAPAVAAIGAATVLDPILQADGSSTAEAATNFAYPVGDLVLLILVATALTTVGRSAGRGWWLLAAGLAAFGLSDVIYLLGTSGNTYVEGGLVDVGWPLASGLIAWAAWEPMPQPARDEDRARTDETLVAAFALLALIVLVAGLFGQVTVIARMFAIVTMTLIVVRLVAETRAARRIEDDRHHQAQTDDLTGLANRRCFGDRLDRALGGLAAEDGRSALLLMDLDHFKEINDSLGHAAGDRLLQEAAQRLRRVTPGSAFVARLGGDEFVVFLEGMETADEAVILADRIRAAFAVPTQVAGMLCHLSASIGIALAPEHGNDRSALLRRADIAMYAAKRSGDGVCLFDPHQEHVSRADVELTGDLRRGIPRGELELHYHPIARVSDGLVHCVETLVRWQHPTHGLLLPDQFLPLAERHGLMQKITDVVLDTALRQQRTWQHKGLGLSVAINLSGHDVLDTGFPAKVADALARTGAAADHLVFEVTEDTVMLDPERILAVLHELVALGIPLALDDYGTGHSSLAYLKQLPVSELKIDRSFVSDMITDGRDAVIVASTVDLGHRLGMRVVAEGVEKAEHRNALVATGCDDMQGFLLTKPLAAPQLEQWLAERNAGVQAA